MIFCKFEALRNWVEVVVEGVEGRDMEVDSMCTPRGPDDCCCNCSHEHSMVRPRCTMMH